MLPGPPPRDLCTISQKFPKAGVPVCPRKVSNILQVGCTTYQGTDPRIAQELAKIPSGICIIDRRRPPKNTTNMPKNPPGTLPDFAKHSPRQLPTPIPTNWPTSLISGRCPQGFFQAAAGRRPSEIQPHSKMTLHDFSRLSHGNGQGNSPGYPKHFACFLEGIA